MAWGELQNPQARETASGCSDQSTSRRRLLDGAAPRGFVRYPYYTVGEVASILCLSDDLIRSLFRNGKQGAVLEISNVRPGRRIYRTLLIPYETLAAFLTRFTKTSQDLS
jgi:hypothetical protein